MRGYEKNGSADLLIVREKYFRTNSLANSTAVKSPSVTSKRITQILDQMPAGVGQSTENSIQ